MDIPQDGVRQVCGLEAQAKAGRIVRDEQVVDLVRNPTLEMEDNVRQVHGVGHRPPPVARVYVGVVRTPINSPCDFSNSSLSGARGPMQTRGGTLEYLPCNLRTHTCVHVSVLHCFFCHPLRR